MLRAEAAVSARSGTATMHLYGRSKTFVGASSSLSASKVAEAAGHIISSTSKAGAALKLQSTAKRVVPLLSMRAVLDAIPSHMTLWYLKTDMQGHDFEAISSVGCWGHVAARVETTAKGFVLGRSHVDEWDQTSAGTGTVLLPGEVRRAETREDETEGDGQGSDHVPYATLALLEQELSSLGYLWLALLLQDGIIIRRKGSDECFWVFKT